MTDLLGDFTPHYAALAESYEPNDTMATAPTLGEGHYEVEGSYLDWYAFEVGPGELSFTLTHPAAVNTVPQDLNMALYAANGQALASGFSAQPTESFEFFATQAGTYYLKVFRAGYPEGAPDHAPLHYTLDVALPQKTWSVELDFGPVRGASPAVYDIDNDGQDEIFVGTSKALNDAGQEIRPGGLIALNADGTVKWSKIFDAAEGPDSVTGQSYRSTSVSTAPTFSDVNGDGSIDILVGVGADNGDGLGTVGQPGDKGGLYALDAEGNTLWYFETRDFIGDDGRPDGIYGAPRVFDIDGDGVREVLFTSWDHYFYALDGRTGALEFEIYMHDSVGATPGVADLNGDGSYELIIPSDITNNAAAGLPQQGGILHVVSNYGQHNIAGFDGQVGSSTGVGFRGKFEEQSLWSSPKFVDLDRDGSLEIVQGTGDFFKDGRGEYLKVWNADGTLRFEFETIGRTLAEPIIADLDGDGRAEIVAATTSGYVYGWNADGAQLFATRVLPFSNNDALIRPIMNAPLAVDIDNAGGDLEILVTIGGQLVVLDSDGTQLTGIDRAEYVLATGSGSPIAKDIDGDGRLDLIGAGTNLAHDQAVVYRWENLTDTVAAEYRSAAYQNNQSLQDIRAFVERFYDTILGREADAAGSNNWTDRLYSGVKSGADVARGFIFSPEFTSRATSAQTYVETLYSAFFDRTADATGLGNWTARIESGAMSRAQVLEGFIGSQEFAVLADGYGIRAAPPAVPTGPGVVRAGDDEPSVLRGRTGDDVLYDGAALRETGVREQDSFGQVYRLYGATLDREPNIAGLLNWFNALNSGLLSPQSVAGGFVSSAEFQNTYGDLGNADFVSLLYRNVLGRTPDAQGLANWTAQLDSGAMTRAQVVLGFSDSAEYRRSTTPALDDFMRMQEPLWIDVLEGGAGNDVMNGGHGGDVFVFRAGQGGVDTIHGFEPWDILQLSGFGFTSSAQAISHMTQSGANVVFDYADQVITFLDTRLAEMSRVRYNLS